MTRTIAVLLFASLSISSAFAFTTGWDTSSEVNSREWTTANTTWAKNNHPDDPSATFLQNNIEPPPREMWCVDSTLWPEDCAAFDHAMVAWLHYYLDLDYNEALPSNISTFPKECPSSCTW